jgi:hypothetical protein
LNQNRYSKIFTKKKVASSAVCMVLAVSLFAGCAHFESIEYSQEISEENPETIEAFDQFINDIFETEVTENTINLHFTISDPEKYGITDYPVTLGDLSNDAMSDSNARLENYLSGLSSFSYTELTLNQQLTYDILENYFQLQSVMVFFRLGQTCELINSCIKSFNQVVIVGIRNKSITLIDNVLAGKIGHKKSRICLLLLKRNDLVKIFIC